ncbi:hypothetical protein BK140_31375 [Paenibacillus macerans]|nr:hypothetical protein BK140_31375 [Paenibacillus macerans]
MSVLRKIGPFYVVILGVGGKKAVSLGAAGGMMTFFTVILCEKGNNAKITPKKYAISGPAQSWKDRCTGLNLPVPVSGQRYPVIFAAPNCRIQTVHMRGHLLL